MAATGPRPRTPDAHGPGVSSAAEVPPMIQLVRATNARRITTEIPAGPRSKRSLIGAPVSRCLAKAARIELKCRRISGGDNARCCTMSANRSYRGRTARRERESSLLGATPRRRKGTAPVADTNTRFRCKQEGTAKYIYHDIYKAAVGGDAVGISLPVSVNKEVLWNQF